MIRKLENKLKTTTQEINKVVKESDDNKVLWLQVLLPKTYLLKQIEAHTYTLIEKENYKKFINLFVYGEDDSEKIKRSLYYLTFDESFKYEKVSEEKIIKQKKDYELINDGSVIIENDELFNNLSNSDNLEPYWNEWCNSIKKLLGNSSTLWSYLKIPSSNTDKNKILSYYVIFEKPINCEIIKSKVNKILQEFLVQYGFETYSSELKKTALQSSLSAVISRNQSHNIGSHVLNNLSNPEKIKAFLYENRNQKKGVQEVSSLLKKGGYISLYTINGLHQEKKRYHLTGNMAINNSRRDNDSVSDYLTKKDLYPEHLIAHFNTYLKSRMDFIADVGTSVQASLMNTSNLFDEVFAFFEKNLILLREISGKEDEFQYGFKLSADRKTDKSGLKVAMPNGLLGQQAFYIILENIIRNTAKHENLNEEEKVCFTIDVNSETQGIYKNFCEVTIYSNLSKRIDEITNLINARNASIDEPILDKNNNVRQGGWGTIEMKLAAAYLCGVNLLDIDDEAYRVYMQNNRTVTFPILEAVRKIVNGKNHFGYRFYLRKPKLALVIFEDYKKNKESIENLNGQAGIYATHKGEIFLGTKIFNHDFLVYLGDNFNEEKWLKMRNLPQRVLHLNDLPEKIEEEFLWDCYFKQHLIDKFKEISFKSARYFKSIDEKYRFDVHGGKFHNEKNSYQYIEPFGTTSLMGQNFKDLDKNELFFNWCCEAIATSVLVVDERIQTAQDFEYIPEKTQGGPTLPIKFSEIYQKTGIIVPSSDDINLNKSNLRTSEIQKTIEKYINDNIEQVQYLVLHYGIVEIFEELNEKKFLTTIQELVEEKNPKCKIVIVSGRGQTKDIPQEHYFINYSTFSYYLTNPFGRSKLHLTKLLKTARVKKLNL